MSLIINPENKGANTFEIPLISIEKGQGHFLQEKTHGIMQDLLNNRPIDFAEVSVLSRNIIVWFLAMLDNRDAYSEFIWNERNHYFRALFNLTTDSMTRRSLVALKTCTPLVRMIIHLLSLTGTDNANFNHVGVLTASMSNLIFEEATKREINEECNAAALFTKLLCIPNSTVLTHAARGVFSLTTVFEFKKLFAFQPGLLSALIRCLQQDNEELITNAAGALANIAIHPESKVPIGKLGSLPILVHHAKLHPAESVLHQVSRCLFSLAAERSNRMILLNGGVLEAIDRLLRVSSEDVLANTIGCLGNLGISDSSDCANHLDRLLTVFRLSEHNMVLDRQCARVLYSLVNQRNLLPKFEPHFNVISQKFITSQDEHVIRDLAGVLFYLVERNSVVVRSWGCETSLFSRCIQLHRSKHNLENITTLARLTFVLSEDPVIYNQMYPPMTIFLLARSAFSPSRIVSQFSFGTLANLALNAKMIPQICIQENLVHCALMILFECDVKSKRVQACRFLQNISQRQAEAYTYLADFGGLSGEKKRSTQDMQKLFKSTFQIKSFPLTSASNDERFNWPCFEEGAIRGGLKTLELKSSVPNEIVLVSLFTPFIESVCPGLILGKTLFELSASVEEWSCLFEYLSTRSSVSFNVFFAESTISLLDRLNLPECTQELENIHLCRTLLQSSNTARISIEESIYEDDNKDSKEGFQENLPLLFEFYSCDVSFRFPLPVRSGGRITRSSSKLSSYAPLSHPELAQMYIQWGKMDGENSILFHAHKQVLVVRCEYFRAFFKNSWSDNESTVVDLDMSVESFLVLFRYIYFGLDPVLKRILAEDKELAFDVYVVASKYRLPGLQYFCEFSLLRNVKVPSELNTFLAKSISFMDAPFLKLELATLCLTKRKRTDLVLELSVFTEVLDQVGLINDQQSSNKRVRIQE